jgi:hypothetical protein
MNAIQWPHWVERREQIALDAVVRFAAAVKGDDGSRNVATRDVVRAIGFTDRNSVGVLADLIEKNLNQRVST